VINKFVGDVVRLRGRMHAQPGKVLVVYQNGRPARVITSGHRTARAFRAPLVGDLEISEINVGVVDVTVTLLDLPTDDDFVVRSIVVKVKVKLNRDDDYAAFARHLQVTGPSYADALIEQLRADLEERLRRAFRENSHDALYGAALNGFLGPRNLEEPMGNGLLVLTSLTVDSVVWDPKFLRLRDQAATIAIVHADAEIQRVTVEADVETRRAMERREAAALDERVRVMEPIAGQLGIDLMDLANPVLAAASKDRSHQLLMQLMDPANRGAIARSPEIVSQLMESSGIKGIDYTRRTPKSAQARRVVTGDASTSIEGSPPQRLPPAVSTESSGYDDFSIDRRSMRIWNGAAPGSANGIVGLGFAVVDGAATVVAVGATGPPRPSDEVNRALASLYGAPVTVIALAAAPAPDVAIDWFESVKQTAHPDFATVRSRADVDVDPDRAGFDRLTLLAIGPVQAANSIVKYLNLTSVPHLAALAAVLPFADIFVKRDDRAP